MFISLLCSIVLSHQLLNVLRSQKLFWSKNLYNVYNLMFSYISSSITTSYMQSGAVWLCFKLLLFTLESFARLNISNRVYKWFCTTIDNNVWIYHTTPNRHWLHWKLLLRWKMIKTYIRYSIIVGYSFQILVLSL